MSENVAICFFIDYSTEPRFHYRKHSTGEKHMGTYDLGIIGSGPGGIACAIQAKTIARTLDNPQDHIGFSTLVIGGGNAAADVVAALSRAKRDANDATPVYWSNRMEHFEINTDIARDLGEEILLGGHIRILQGALPRIGEVDEDGVDHIAARLSA